MATKAEDSRPKEVFDENACVVCFKPVQYFSIGSCNHPVCYECSSRMRVICLQNECPICRADLPKVIFTVKIAPFTNLDRELRSGLYEKKYRIAFESLEIQKSFYRLLEHRCPRCDHTPFVEFSKLKEHVRKVHEMFYCEICTENLKIFSAERRAYTRSELATHRRSGDANDKSHKGHPLCEYCELRFLDKDELFRHLRREHYYCHLCDADGNNLFFGSIEEMRDHFKSDHFLCEEEECFEEQFTAVFRSEIDLKAHRATAHSKGMSRNEVRQARTLDLEFSYAPRGRGGGEGEARGRRPRQHDTQREFDRIPERVVQQQPPIQIDAKNEEQFPSLAGPAAAPTVQLANTVRHAVYGTSGLARTKENFPSLGGEKVEKPKNQSQQPAKQGKQYQQPSASSLLKGQNNSKKSSNQGTKKTGSDFPALGSSSGSAFPDFPALSSVVPKKAPTSTQRSVPRKTQQDFPAFQPASTPKKNKKDLLMEDMVETSSGNKNLVSSKHRGLVDEYVSMASTVSKVQTVQQKDIQPAAEYVKKSVPKLNSADNFPTLGGGSSGGGGAGGPAWLNVAARPEKAPKKSKVHQMPVKPPANKQNGVGAKKPQEKPKANKENKKSKNDEMMEDLIEPTTSVNMNLVSAKHRGLVDDYVSIADKISKVKTIQQKDIQPAVSQVKKDVPKLNSIDNFPSLGGGFSAPPGFDKVPKKPPPGFALIEEYQFLPPPNNSVRNAALAKEFEKVLKTPESMQEFKNVSKMFRDGDYFARSYYETCQHVLGIGFDGIFPELLVLLPDIEKQQSLYKIHLETLRRNGEKSNKKTKQLEACATCRQVLLNSDLKLHLQSHVMENNWTN